MGGMSIPPLRAARPESSAAPLIDRVVDTLDGIIVGKTMQLKLAVTCLLARGHLLIEDLPGVGKTTLAHALAKAVGTPGETIMLEHLPSPDDYPADHEAEQEIEWVQQFVVGIRQIRGEMNLSPTHRLAVKLAGASELDRARVARHRGYLERLAGLAEIAETDQPSAVRGAATALLGEMQILVPLAGLIDIAAERDRLGKQLARASSDLEKCLRKLGDERFVANAPADVVAKERERVAELEQRSERLRRQIELLDEIV